MSLCNECHVSVDMGDGSETTTCGQYGGPLARCGVCLGVIPECDYDLVSVIDGVVHCEGCDTGR